MFWYASRVTPHPAQRGASFPRPPEFKSHCQTRKNAERTRASYSATRVKPAMHTNANRSSGAWKDPEQAMSTQPLASTCRTVQNKTRADTHLLHLRGHAGGAERRVWRFSGVNTAVSLPASHTSRHPSSCLTRPHALDHAHTHARTRARAPQRSGRAAESTARSEHCSLPAVFDIH